MPTIYDVAKAANTSAASVSRVLNGRPGVKDNVEVRIRKAMEALEFQPRWKVMDHDRILLLLPDNKYLFSAGWIAQISSGVADAAFGMGLGVQMRLCGFLGKGRDLRQAYLRESVCGSIMISAPRSYPLVKELEAAGLPHIIVGHKAEDDGVNQISLDDVKAGREATQFLLSLGHRRIAMVSFSHAEPGHRARYQGFEEAMMAETQQKPVCIQCMRGTYDSGRFAARQLLSPIEKPTAVIVTNEEIAVGFQAEVKAMGFSMPKDLSVIAFEETDILSLLDVPITAMRTPAYEMGVEAVTKLSAIVAGTTPPPPPPDEEGQNKHLEISLIARYSTAALK